MINFIYRVLNSDPHLPTEINRLTIELTLGSEEVQMLVQKRNAIANLSSPNNNNQQQLENGIRPNVSQYSICILHTKYFCCGISCNFSFTLFYVVSSLLKFIFSEKATKIRRNLQKYFCRCFEFIFGDQILVAFSECMNFKKNGMYSFDFLMRSFSQDRFLVKRISLKWS